MRKEEGIPTIAGWLYNARGVRTIQLLASDQMWKKHGLEIMILSNNYLKQSSTKNRPK
jgi:hypothetical protein